MNMNALVLALAAVIVCALYLMRRRTRLAKED
jgi:hypothetical protein